MIYFHCVLREFLSTTVPSSAPLQIQAGLNLNNQLSVQTDVPQNSNHSNNASFNVDDFFLNN